MTTATQKGRRLALALEGADEEFLVDPLSARRGKYLTDRFLLASMNKLSLVESEQIFIECFGPANYSRMTSLYVDVVTVVLAADGSPETVSDPILTFGPAGEANGRDSELPKLLGTGAWLIAREAKEGEDEIDEMPIRQAEADALSLCAFYWQTVVGIEAVNEFLAAGEGTEGSLKAMTLLLIRLGLSRNETSSNTVTAPLTQGDDSTGTSVTPSSSAAVRLPANKRGFLPKRNAPTSKPRRGA